MIMDRLSESSNHHAEHHSVHFESDVSNKKSCSEETAIRKRLEVELDKKLEEIHLMFDNQISSLENQIKSESGKHRLTEK